jgi:hypothetical protein
MKKLFIPLLLISCSASTALADSLTLPADVAKFVDRRKGCDHWRGEYGYDEERQADIDWALCQSCVGTDDELAQLKKQYADNNRVIEKLNGLEPVIEPQDKAAIVQFCKTTRKPEWLDDAL